MGLLPVPSVFCPREQAFEFAVPGPHQWPAHGMQTPGLSPSAHGIGQAGDRTRGPIDIAGSAGLNAGGSNALRRYVPPLGFNYVCADPIWDEDRRGLINPKLHTRGLRRL